MTKDDEEKFLEMGQRNNALRHEVAIIEKRCRDLERQLEWRVHPIALQDDEQAAWDLFAAALIARPYKDGAAVAAGTIGAMADEMLIERRERRQRRVGGP